MFFRAFRLAGLLFFLLVPVRADERNIATGRRIPGGRYCDQPYVVKTDDGAWLCVMTTADGPEGSATQNVISLRSTDRGVNWSKPLPLEKPGGPEASYAVLLKVPSGRVYCFYNHNTDNVRSVRTEDGKSLSRVDSLGHYVFRYTDDHGRTWSPQRYEVPVRPFACDRNNVYGGKLRFFWNVGRPLLIRPGADRPRFWKEPDAAVLTLHKVGAMGTGFFAQSEGAFLRSTNILTESDPTRLRFDTLPEGDVGLRTPAGGGRIAEEQSVVQLSDGSLYCVYRSVDGHPVCSTSRDGGRSWSPPQYQTYTPGGRRFKHPRAANFVWKCGNGRYLYWFHNHGPAPAARRGWDPYADRNPAWLSAGREQDGPAGKVLVWSQPEVALYDDDPFVRISYPDLIEDGNEYYLTETQKHLGRVHRVDRTLLDGLFRQHEATAVARAGLLFDHSGKTVTTARPPKLPPFLTRDMTHEDMRTKDLRAGCTFEVRFDAPQAGRTQLLQGVGTGESGYDLTSEPDGSVRLWMSDGRTEVAWASDAGLVKPGRSHHVVAIVDGGPKVITFVVDGVLCDGGEQRPFGWGRFSPHFRGPVADTLRVHPAVKRLRIYGRALRTSEAVGNYRATP